MDALLFVIGYSPKLEGRIVKRVRLNHGYKFSQLAHPVPLIAL